MEELFLKLKIKILLKSFNDQIYLECFADMSKLGNKNFIHNSSELSNQNKPRTRGAV